MESFLCLKVIVVSGLIWLFHMVFYNMWFHPLSCYPGPWYTRGSRLWYIFKVFQGRHKIAIKELHDEYGLVVRIAPNELSYIDPKAWNDIYGASAHHNGSSTLEKDQEFFATAFGDSNNLVGAKSDTYKVQKNNAVRGFSHGQLLQKGDVMSSHLQFFVQNLRSHLASKADQGIIDIDAWIGNLILDIHVALTIGSEFHAISKGPSSHSLVNNMHKTVTILQYCTQLLYLPLPITRISALPIFSGRDILSTFTRVSSLGTAINERLERMYSAEKCTDFVHRMMTDQRGGTIDHDTIKRNALIIILSGIETIPDYICSVLFYTLETPEYFTRLREEITSTFRNCAEISATSVQNLRFLKACMHESLRLAPPFVGTLPRRVPTSTSGVTICGQFVPSGTTVGIHNWSITHSRRFWKDPEHFKPDRWMGDSSYTDDMREAFHPFGFGPRACVARNLVFIEASLILARMLFEFDMQLDSSSHNWPTRKGHLVPVKRPLFVKVMSGTRESTTTEA